MLTFHYLSKMVVFKLESLSFKCKHAVFHDLKTLVHQASPFTSFSRIHRYLISGSYLSEFLTILQPTQLPKINHTSSQYTLVNREGHLNKNRRFSSFVYTRRVLFIAHPTTKSFLTTCVFPHINELYSNEWANSKFLWSCYWAIDYFIPIIFSQ